MEHSLREWFKDFPQRLKQNSCMNLVWLINVLPTIAGIPLMSKKNNVTFWIIHATLLVYVYIVGTVVYHMYYVEDFVDSIKSFFNVSIFVIILVPSLWIFYKRNDLNDLLKLVKKNDDLVIESGRCLDVHQKLLKSIKSIIIMCYIFHFVNNVIIFIPSRTLRMDNFSVASCVGLEPLSASPNREACMGILAFQELFSIVPVGCYDITLLFFFSHTTAIFEILYQDLRSFNEIADRCENSDEAYCELEDRLKHLIIRHYLALHTVNKLESIYSVAIGINFVFDAITLCVFFVLPLDVCLNFVPLICHIVFIFFLYCFQGQRLTTASEKFEMAVYCCGWENLRVKEQTKVLLMLKQAQNPVIVYAARVIPIRMHTFAQTLQAIYKFVTIFKA